MLLITEAILSQSNITFKFKLYDDLDVDSITPIKNKLESNAGRIMSDLNVEYSGKFTVHVWHNNESFLDAQEEKLGMRVYYSTGYIYGYSEIAVLYIDNPQERINSTGLLYCFTPEEIAEHEFAHCISLRVRSNFTNNPRWLWEAVAIYEANEFYDPKTLDYLISGNYPSINELNNDFNNGDYRIYQVGYLIIEFIIDKWGKDKYIELIKNSGNVKNVLGISIEEFEKEWKEFVDIKYFGQTAINVPQTNDYSLLLNQSSSHLNLTCKNDLFTGGFIQIFDMNGTIVSANNIIDNHPDIDLSFLTNGIYIVSIRKGDLSVFKKIIFRK
jgi:hypothetical protein